METNNIEKVNFTSMSQHVMRIIRTHCGENKELEKDLFGLIEAIEKEQRKQDDIRELAFLLANKL